LLSVSSASADPRQGEGRSLLRDADRVVTTVAGDADASATVQNPGNLGFLLGRAMTLDVSMAAPASRRRGSGFGGFFAIPLPRNLATFGVGLQWMWPNQPAAESTLTTPEFRSADAPYTKLSLAMGVPLMRWIPGLSMGLGVHHMVSGANAWAHGVTALDVGLGWRANRFLSVGVVARQLNVPVIGPTLAGDSAGAQRVPLTVDPEIAVRPLGRRNWELAVGARVDTRRASSVRFRGSTIPIQPRVRTLINFPGGGLFAEAELYATRVDPVADPTLDAKVSAGLVLQLARSSTPARTASPCFVATRSSTRPR
jgi:protease-4